MKYMTTREKAEELNASQSNITKLASEGKIPGSIKKQGSRGKPKWLIPAEWLPEHIRLLRSGEYETIYDASDRLNCNYSTLYKLIAEGGIPGAVKPSGSRFWLVPANFDIDDDTDVEQLPDKFVFPCDDPWLNLLYAVFHLAARDARSNNKLLRVDASCFFGDMQWIVDLLTPDDYTFQTKNGIRIISAT